MIENGVKGGEEGMVVHPIAPIFDAHSRVLILGSFPSEVSRQVGFYYGHPRNRFWKVVSALFETDEPDGTEAKRAFLLRHQIALWDVIASCDIEKSADASIRNVVVNDIGRILSQAEIQAIFVNGKTAERYYNRYLFPMLNREATVLPSTSPANASWSVDRLTAAWKEALNPYITERKRETL